MVTSPQKKAPRKFLGAFLAGVAWLVLFAVLEGGGWMAQRSLWEPVGLESTFFVSPCWRAGFLVTGFGGLVTVSASGSEIGLRHVVSPRPVSCFFFPASPGFKGLRSRLFEKRRPKNFLYIQIPLLWPVSASGSEIGLRHVVSPRPVSCFFFPASPGFKGLRSRLFEKGARKTFYIFKSLCFGQFLPVGRKSGYDTLCRRARFPACSFRLRRVLRA